jgi:hypothetical protein
MKASERCSQTLTGKSRRIVVIGDRRSIAALANETMFARSW